MKVKEIHYIKVKPGMPTGLYLVLEDGRVLEALSTDVLEPYHVVGGLPEEFIDEEKV